MGVQKLVITMILSRLIIRNFDKMIICIKIVHFNVVISNMTEF